MGKYKMWTVVSFKSSLHLQAHYNMKLSLLHLVLFLTWQGNMAEQPIMTVVRLSLYRYFNLFWTFFLLFRLK